MDVTVSYMASHITVQLSFFLLKHVSDLTMSWCNCEPFNSMSGSLVCVWQPKNGSPEWTLVTECSVYHSLFFFSFSFTISWDQNAVTSWWSFLDFTKNCANLPSVKAETTVSGSPYHIIKSYSVSKLAWGHTSVVNWYLFPNFTSNF